jgi:hypothetical protein
MESRKSRNHRGRIKGRSSLSSTAQRGGLAQHDGRKSGAGQSDGTSNPRSLTEGALTTRLQHMPRAATGESRIQRISERHELFAWSKFRY